MKKLNNYNKINQHYDLLLIPNLNFDLKFK